MTIRDEPVRRSRARDKTFDIMTVGWLTDGATTVVQRATNSRKLDHA